MVEFSVALPSWKSNVLLMRDKGKCHYSALLSKHVLCIFVSLYKRYLLQFS